MRALLGWTLAAIVLLSGVSQTRSAEKKDAVPGSAKEKLVGAWRLAWMEEAGPVGKLRRITDRKGMLLYTPDGHMSVQIVFPKSESTLFNDYVQSGYEASFGSYDVNEDAHTVTHHVVGSITRGLVGKDLTRVYQFSDGHLIIKSSRSDTLVSYVGALLTDLQTPLTFGKKALRRRTNAKTETWKKQSGSIRYRTGLHGTELWPRASGREAAGDLAD